MAGNPYLDFAAVSKLPWKHRNAAIEAALRTYLSLRYDKMQALDTYSLASRLDNATSKEQRAKLAQILARMAPYMLPFATHDGESIKRYGRVWRRWLWHGQAPTPADVKWDMED